MRYFYSTLFLVIFLSIAPQIIYPQWLQTNGPTGAWVYSMAINGANTFAGTSNFGVVISTDKGMNWSKVNNGMGNTSVLSLAIQGNNILAGTMGVGSGGSSVFLSTNNGTNWSPVGLNNENVFSLVVSENKIFAGTWNDGVFISTNSGANWTNIGPTLTNIRSLAVSGTNIFVGTVDGVFLSTNNGANWSQVNNGLTNLDILSLAISEPNIFAGTAGGVFLSTNNGANWSQVNNGMTNSLVQSLVISKSNIFAGTLGGVFLSTNNGTNWLPMDLNDESILSLAADETSIFAGTTSGVFLSTNDGANWTPVNNGITCTGVNSLTISGSDIFAASWEGVFLSGNDGTNWTRVNKDSFLASVVNGTNIFAGTNGHGIFLSTNNGTNWLQLYNSPSFIWSLAVCGTDIFAGTTGGVFSSSDNGTNWTQANNGISNNNIFSLAVCGTNIFAGTNYGGIFLSTNNGANWTQINNGLTNTNIHSLAVCGTNIFAGSDVGVFLSTNNGTNWAIVNNGLTVTPVSSLHVNGTNIFAGTAIGVFLSTNNGTNWAQIGLSGMAINALCSNETYIFAGTPSEGVWKRPLSEISTLVKLLSPSGGENWLVSSSHDITWTSSNIQNVKIEYSTDNGVSWVTISNSTPANTGSFSWTIPNTPTNNALLKISDAIDGTPFSVSSNIFTISSATTQNKPLFLLKPNNAADATYLYFKNLLTNNSIVFSELTAAQLLTADISNSIVVAGFTTEATEFNTQQIGAKLISSIEGGSWFLFEGAAIYLMQYANLGSISFGNWNPVVFDKWAYVSEIDNSPLFNGINSWTPPSQPDRPEQYILNLVAHQSFQVPVYNPPVNTIADSLHAWGLFITYGWPFQSPNSEYCTNWGGCSTERAVSKIAFIIRNFSNGKLFHSEGLGVINGVFLYGPVTEKIHINYINWANNYHANSLSLLSPNGGEVWAAGSQHNITWTSANINNVKIEYSTNGGTNWSLIISSTSAASGSFSWTLPGISSTNCKIKISDAGSSGLVSISAQPFSILPPIDIPVLTYPTANIIVYTLSPSLTWYVLSGGVGLTYEIQYSTNSNFEVAPLPVTVTSNTITKVISGLLPGTTYYWRVRAYNPAVNLYSAYSTAECFTTSGSTGPVAPVPLWPTGGAVLYTGNTTLVWYHLTAFPAGLTYDVEINTTGTFTGIPTQTAITGLSTTVNSLTGGQTYYWQVRSKLGSSYSAWSSPAVFSTASVAAGLPVVPIPCWPIDGALAYSINPSITWYITTYVPGLSYELRYGTTSGVYTNMVTSSTITISLNGLLAGTKYYYQIRSKCGVLYSEWCSEQVFQTTPGSGTAPYVPNPLWPPDGIIIYTASPPLSWSMLTTQGIAGYRVILSLYPDMSSASIFSTANMSLTLSGLIQGQTYYWQVQSFNGTVYSAYSTPVQSFTLDPGTASPVVPVTGSPVEGVQVTTTSPVLSWYIPASQPGLTYELQCADNKNFFNAATFGNLDQTSKQLSGLTAGTTYYWKVRSKTAEGIYSNYSYRGMFTPGMVTGTKPENAQMPDKFDVSQNYPNPFNPSTSITYSITEPSFVAIRIYDMLGLEIKTVTAEHKNIGTHTVQWNSDNNQGRRVSSGIYIVKVTAGANAKTIKMILMK